MEDKQRLVTRYHLTPDVLNREVSKRTHNCDRANHLMEASGENSCSKRSPWMTSKGMVLMKNQGEIMMLDKWQARFGSDATYNKLIDAMISAKKIAEAEGVCKLIGQ